MFGICLTSNIIIYFVKCQKYIGNYSFFSLNGKINFVMFIMRKISYNMLLY